MMILKNYLTASLLLFLFMACDTKTDSHIQKVASFQGQQVTGITVDHTGRIFANFPRWRKGVENSVVEITGEHSLKPYPNNAWNSWEIGQKITDSVFVAVQSVVASENNLYIIDTRNPLFGGVIGTPKIFVFDLKSNQLKNTYHLADTTFYNNSYINDVRIDEKNQKAYFTDSGRAGIIVLDLPSGKARRVLDNHVSTRAEIDYLSFEGKPWRNTVHSDGIALDTLNGLLYYHALTGYKLYAVPTEKLINASEEEIQKAVKFVRDTPAPDGMIIDTKGDLYLADLEHDKIMKIHLATNEMTVFAEGEKVKWADTFALYNNELYYTNSRINEVGTNLSEMEFTIYKLPLK